MNWEAISAIGQIVGAFAVVISLIYLASEVRRNTRATQLAAMRSMHDAFNRWIQQLTERPDVRELYYRGIHDFDSLKGADLVGFSTLMNQLFRTLRRCITSSLAGHLEKGVWHGWKRPIASFNAYPGVQAWWRLRSHWFSEEFVKFVNQLQQTAKPPRMYREPMKMNDRTNRSTLTLHARLRSPPAQRSSRRRSDFRCAAVKKASQNEMHCGLVTGCAESIHFFYADLATNERTPSQAQGVASHERLIGNATFHAACAGFLLTIADSSSTNAVSFSSAYTTSCSTRLKE